MYGPPPKPLGTREAVPAAPRAAWRAIVRKEARPLSHGAAFEPTSHMIADLAANFVPTGTNVAAVADTLLDQDFESMHDVMEVDLTASDLREMFPFDPDLVVALRVGLAVAVVVRGVTLLGTASYTPPTAAAAVASACRDLARARLLPVFAQPAPLPIMLPVAAVEVQPMTPTTIVMAQAVDP